MLSALSTENHDFFSSTAQRIRSEIAKENTEMIEKDDHYRFLSAGHPVTDIDLHGSDNTMCDGRASFAERESHIRLTALLNGIWMRMNDAYGIKNMQEACQKWDDLVPRMSRWRWNDRMFPFLPHYVQDTNMSVGIIDIDSVCTAICSLSVF